MKKVRGLARMATATVTEWCPNCGWEVELPEVFKPHECPKCKNRILPCNQCDEMDCTNCPLN